MIFNPYNFVPLTAHIKLEINYSIKSEHIFTRELSIMALNDTFIIEEINLDKKYFKCDINDKELAAHWNSECA